MIILKKAILPALALFMALIFAFASVVNAATPSPSIPQMATIDISSVPPGADIFYEINGRVERPGITPRVIRVQAGDIDVLLAEKGYLNYTKSFRLKEGDNASIVAILELVPSPTPVNTSPTYVPIDYACNKKTLPSRIECILGLPDNEYAAKIYHEPEECRLLKVNKSKMECQEKYRKFAICDKERLIFDMEKCAQKILGMESVEIEYAKCEKKKVNKTECFESLRLKTYELIKYRIGTLEAQAIRLKNRGVLLSTIVETVVGLEEQRLLFDKAPNLEKRKQVIWEIQRIWGEFRKDSIVQVKDYYARMSK